MNLTTVVLNNLMGDVDKTPRNSYFYVQIQYNLNLDK